MGKSSTGGKSGGKSGGKRGRPKLPVFELTTEHKQAILDYIKQGKSINEVAQELGTTISQIKKIYNRYLNEASESIELDRVDMVISRIIETTVSPREARIAKMHEMLNRTVDKIYESSMDENGELQALDAGDFAMILKLLERDEQTVMASGRLQTVKKKNNDSRYMFNKEKMIKTDELARQYDDTREEDILTVENVINDLESD